MAEKNLPCYDCTQKYIRTSIFIYLKIMKALNLSKSRLVKGGFFSATLARDLLTDESHMHLRRYATMSKMSKQLTYFVH